MKVSVEVKNVDGVNRYLTKKGIDVTQAVWRGIARGTLFVQGEVKESIAGRRQEKRSVDTGKFINSVHARANQDVGTVSTNLEYAPFLEYGSSRIRARKHFNNSAMRSKTRVAQLIDKEIKQAVKK